MLLCLIILNENVGQIDPVEIGKKPTLIKRPKLIALDNLSKFKYKKFDKHLQAVKIWKEKETINECKVDEIIRNFIFCGQITDNESTEGHSGKWSYNSCRL